MQHANEEEHMKNAEMYMVIWISSPVGLHSTALIRFLSNADASLCDLSRLNRRLPKPSIWCKREMTEENTPRQRTPNDQRSDVHNSTSDEYSAAMNNHANQSNNGSAAHQAAMDNRAKQMNPQHPAYHSSRRGGKGRK